MEKANSIAAGLIIISIGGLIALCEYRHALFITGLFISFSGLGMILETFNNGEK